MYEPLIDSLMKGNFKKIVFVIRTTPFNTVALSEAFRMGIGMTASDNKVNILLLGDGVWNVLNLSPHLIGRPDLYESMELFSACGVRVFADDASLKERNIEVLESHVEKVCRDAVYKIISDSDTVMSFK